MHCLVDSVEEFMDYYKRTPFNYLLNVDTIFYMKRFLQILERFVPEIGIGFGKYLFAFCILISVQMSTFAQGYTYLDVKPANPVKQGVVHVKPGTEVTISVSGQTIPGMPVTWMYRTERKPDVGDNKQTLVGETGTSITYNVTRDIEFQATYQSVFGQVTDRVLISCAELVLSVGNTNEACPEKAVEFAIVGGQLSDNGKFEKKENGPAWQMKRQFSVEKDKFKGDTIVTRNESGTSNFSVRASLEYSYFNAEKGNVNFDAIDITIRTDCKAECLTTSTGDYYVGTDFDPNRTGASVIPQDIVSHFGDYNIDLLEGDLKAGDYWLGTDVEGFFGQVPYNDMVAGVGGKNNYLFCQNPNQRICELKFSPVSEFVGKTYKYKMRLYLQKERGCNIDPNAKFKARTGQGKVTTDHLYGSSYNNNDGSLIRTAEGYEEGDMTLAFAQLINQEDVQDYDMIKVEIVFDGQFPLDEKYDPIRNEWNGLKAFSFMPEFAQMSCWKIALDYISAEIENVCLSPQILCAGAYTTAHAAGFPENSDFRWYKKVGGKLVDVTSEVKHPNGNPSDAYIKAEVGKVEYQLQVEITGIGKRTHDFVVTGNDCEIVNPTEINGGTFCMPSSSSFSQTYAPNIVDYTSTVTYSWEMYKPNGDLWYDSKSKSDTHFAVYTSKEFRDSSSPYYCDSKNDSLVITMDPDDAATIEEGDYKLVLKAYNDGAEQSSLEKTIHIYRNPDITLKLLGDKFVGVESESDKKICPSDKRREIIAYAENAFTSSMMGQYTYVWNSIPGSAGVFTPLATDPSKATVNLSAIPGICDGDVDNVEFTVNVYIDGCSDDDNNKYDLEALGEISINCNSLIGVDDTFYLPSKKEEMQIRIPIPKFESGCDTDPKIIIEFKSNRPEIDAVLGTKKVEVYKSEIASTTSLDVTLPWGEYDFHYTVVDGCGRTKDCHVPINIVKGGPDIPCDQIIDIDTQKGQYNEAEGTKCTVKFNDLNLTKPVLPDLNDEFETLIAGVYEGRINFESQQNKNALMSSAEDRAKFDKTIALEDDYGVNYTYILWSFTNNAGKTKYCVQEVLVENKDLPDFDCDQIKPFRPETQKGQCDIKFKDFWDELKNKNYYAFVYCPEPGFTVPGELHSDPVKISKLEDDRVFKVGVADTVYWQFRDPHDYGDNVKYCPQVINAFSGDSVKVDCDALAYFEATAEEGTCFVKAAELNFPRPPYGEEPCTLIKVPGEGTRSDYPGRTDMLEAEYPTGDTYITWIFKGENSFPSTCTTHIFVKGNKHFNLDCITLFPPKDIVVPDCDSTKVKLEPKKVADPCVAGYMSESVPYFTEYIKDKSGKVIDTTYTLINLKTENPYKFPKVGKWFVTWVFTDYTKNITDTCVQSIHLRDNQPPKVNCDTIPDSYVELDGKCEIPWDDLRDKLGNKAAIEYCTGETIWGEPYLLDTTTGNRTPFPPTVSVGIYPIQWVFANDSLTTEEAKCDKTLYLQHNMEPIFNCDKLKKIQLYTPETLCYVKLDETNLPIPEAYDACVKDYTVYGHGYVQLFGQGEYVELCYFDRNKNKAVYKNKITVDGKTYDVLPLGGHKIKWVFTSPYSTKDKICYQTININSGVFEKISCDDLAETVTFTLINPGPGATYDEIVAAGLIKPTFDDPCGVVDSLYYRSDDPDKDGKDPSIYDIYPEGTTTITWKFMDNSPNTHLSPKKCHTKVIVRDGVTPDLICPNPIGPFTCLDAVPAPYKNLNEFLAAGAKIVSNGKDVSDYAVASTFKVVENPLGDICDYTLQRTYSVENQRGQVSTCVQDIAIKDEEAPEWNVSLASGTQIKDSEGNVVEIEFTDQSQCGPLAFFPENLTATDICQNETLSEYKKVNDFEDLVDGLFYTVSSNRSSDPSDCAYYKYTETRRYIAVDRCRRRSVILSYVANVEDTDPPIIDKINLDEWYKKFVPAEYAHEDCKFLYPDLVSTFPKNVISDNCNNEAVKYFKITQVPAAGTVIRNTKVKQYVTLYITDPCGLQDTAQKEIFVQDNKDIIHITLDTATVCIEQEKTIDKLITSKGHMYTENWFNPGEWDYVENSVFAYDYYKGIKKDEIEKLAKSLSEEDLQKKLDKENLIYSNNSVTHKGVYDQHMDASIFIGLDSLLDEGWYTIIAMDTSLHCTDTATAYITVHSRPTVTLDGAPLVVCENDSIHLMTDDQPLVTKYNVNVDDNGDPIIEAAFGWMVNKQVYEPKTLLPYYDGALKLQYYAKNSCGTGISDDFISVSMRKRMNPDEFMLTTEPNNPSRVFMGESAKLQLVTKYTPDTYMWYKVKGVADGNSDQMYDKYGELLEEYTKDSNYEPDSLIQTSYQKYPGAKVLDMTDLGDSAKYYVLMVDGVCPAVPSNIVAIDVVKKLPTAFTPHNSLGMNDVFMEGHKVIIFNRYGQKMTESDNGWDGTCRGNLVDPGVYFYEVVINEGQRVKGSIEVVYFK